MEGKKCLLFILDPLFLVSFLLYYKLDPIFCGSIFVQKERKTRSSIESGQIGQMKEKGKEKHFSRYFLGKIKNYEEGKNVSKVSISLSLVSTAKKFHKNENGSRYTYVMFIAFYP